MNQLTLRWLVPKLLFLKAMFSLAGVTINLIVKVYESRKSSSASSNSSSSSSPSVSSSPSNGSNNGIDIETTELEDTGDDVLIDEDGFNY